MPKIQTMAPLGHRLNGPLDTPLRLPATCPGVGRWAAARGTRDRGGIPAHADPRLLQSSAKIPHAPTP